MLPYLSGSNKIKPVIVEFKGYNHNKAIAEGELYDMENLCSDEYPLLTTRKNRQVIKTFTTPNGVFAKGNLGYVDGTGFYYGNTLRGTVTDSGKRFYSIGAYVVIMPDKKYFNTATNEFGSIESTFIGTAVISNSKVIAQGIGTYFKQYDAVSISGSNIASNNKKASIIIKVEDNALTFGSSSLADQSSVTITIARKMPDMDFMTEHENRLWGCSSAKHEIYSCKLGDITNWYSYEGLSTDSYAVTIGSDGPFTGACTHLGSIIFFKEDHTHKIYGNKPNNYQVTDTKALGVKSSSELSLVDINGNLFYHSVNGVVVYQGSVPEVISDKLGFDNYIEGIAGTCNGKYYISLLGYSDNSILYVFDTKTGLWFKEGIVNIHSFVEMDGYLYYLDQNSKKLMQIDGYSDEVIPWSAEFGDFENGTFGRKSISKVILKYSLEIGKQMNVYIKYDSEENWTLTKTITSTKDKKTTSEVSIIPKRCDHFRIKITGTGKVTMYQMQKNIMLGSDK